MGLITLASSTHFGALPSEEITMNYAKIEWVAYPVDREQAPSEFIWTRAGGNWLKKSG